MVKSAKWMDLLALVFSLAVIGGATVWTLSSGLFATNALSSDNNLTWHLIRSAGISAYVLLFLSMVWGLFISGRYVKDWSPGPLSLAIHSAVSWLALLLGFIHAGILMIDKYFSYTLSDILIPFTGPYRPLAVGVGIIAIWLLLAINISFPFKKQLGRKVWLTLHMTSYIAFGMVTLHGLTAGTDSTLMGFRVLMGVGVMVVVTMLGVRMFKDSRHSVAVAAKS